MLNFQFTKESCEHAGKRRSTLGEINNGRVWQPGREKRPPLIALIVLPIICLALAVAIIAVTAQQKAQLYGAFAKRTTIVTEKLVSQCSLSTEDANKFFTTDNYLDPIQTVKIKGKATVVKLKEGNNSFLQDFITNKKLCSFAVPDSL